MEEKPIYEPIQSSLSDDSEGEVRKYYVDEGMVEIAANLVYELDPEGKRLRVVEYTDYTCKQLIRMYTSATELKAKWSDTKQRKVVIQALEERGISFEYLAKVTGQYDADPFDLLGQMNLLLHGLEYPQIDPGNSLRFNLRELGEKDRVDVIMTNPPFGGEEERGILGNFPEDKQTSETALLFLQLIMRKLRRSIGGMRGGRCGMVVPNGMLFGTGVAERIKKELLEYFNLNTIVRLPKGVFAPYTDIETNLLFFERDGPTNEIWYYEVPLPEGRKQYTKTKPMKFEEFRQVLDWWKSREENEYAWKASADDVAKNNYNMDIKNPNKAKAEEYRAPEEIVASIVEKEKKIFELMKEIQVLISKGWNDAE